MPIGGTEAESIGGEAMNGMIMNGERYLAGQPFRVAVALHGNGIRRALRDFEDAITLHEADPKASDGRSEMAMALALAASRLAKLTATTESWAGTLPVLTIPSAPPDDQGGQNP